MTSEREVDRPMPIGVNCPRCGAELAKRRSKKGKNFWGCMAWQKTGCDFVLWDKPVPEPCPQCDAKFLVQATRRSSGGLRCVTPGCGYTKAPAEE